MKWIDFYGLAGQCASWECSVYGGTIPENRDAPAMVLPPKYSDNTPVQKGELDQACVAKCALRELLGLEFLVMGSAQVGSDYASTYDRNRIHIDSRTGLGKVRPQNSTVANIGKVGKKWVPIVGNVSSAVSVKPISIKCANECQLKICK